MTYSIDTSITSNNHSSRNGARIVMLVWHATAGSFASALHELCDPKPSHPDDRVSAHYLISKFGVIRQLVPDNRAAWHAGESHWMGMGKYAIQCGSIGIELENANTGRDPYPPAQIGAAHWLGQALIARYNIERADVVRHLDIAPHRKTDPAAPFPWPLFADSLYLDTAPPSPHPPTPAPNPLRHYRVLASVSGGATIRSAPSTSAAVLGHLKAGDGWVGEEVTADTVTTVKGFGRSRVWIRALDQRCVWRNLLEEVKR